MINPNQMAFCLLLVLTVATALISFLKPSTDMDSAGVLDPAENQVMVESSSFFPLANNPHMSGGLDDPGSETVLKQRFIEAMYPATEVVFATRAMLNWESHWYASVGTFCYDTTHQLWYKQGRLCKWNILTDEVTVILSLPVSERHLIQ